MKIVYKILIAVSVLVVLCIGVNLFMIHGVKNHYGLNQHSDILLIGHSHLMLSVDKERLENETGLKVSKYTREGVNVSDREVMVDHFQNSGYADSLKMCLYGVDLCTFTGEGLSQNSYKLFYPFMGNEYVDRYVKSQASPTDYWLHKLFPPSRFNDDGLKNSAFRGWLHNWDSFKTGQVDVEQYKRMLANGDERHINMNPDLMRQFDRTVKKLTSRGVRVVLVNTPTLDLLNEYEPDKYERMMTWFRNYADADSLVFFWDFNPEYASRHEIFRDRLHLNYDGQQIITTEIVKGINRINEKKAEAPNGSTLRK